MVRLADSMPQQTRKDSRPHGPRLTRRQFLAGTLATAGTAFLSSTALGQSPPPPIDTTKVPGFPAGRVGTTTPFEPLERLRSGRHTWFAPLDRFFGTVTPSGLHFVVSHAGVPGVDPRTYKLLIHGMVEHPVMLTLDDLKRFPSVSVPYFVECSGNSANAWFPPEPTDTAQNVHGLTSGSEWTGVPLSTLLKEVRVKPDASWMLAESQDAAVFARSIPIAKAWDDILVAYGQNGEALRPEQGYPARLIVPGWEGSASVKWLRRIELSDRPFMTREETSKYTDVMPDGTSVQFTFEMGVKSIITWPSGGYRIPRTGFWEITGLAWSGRGKIRKVEVSTDNGETWGTARLQEPQLRMAHTRFWYPWIWDERPAVLMSRATDDEGGVQPALSDLVKSRGIHSIYHNNAIQAWEVGATGDVVSKHEPLGGPFSAARDLDQFGSSGCLV